MFRFNNMVIMKVTKDCNLRCEYCYVRNKDDHKGQIVDFELFKNIIDKIIRDRITQNFQHQELQFVFHGGEPLLLPNDQFVNMLEYAHTAFTQSGINYQFNMQSNLTLLTEEKVAILSRYNVLIGASFDGIDDGNLKRTSLGQEYFEDKFELLDKYNIHYGFLLVIGSDNIDDVVKTTEFLKEKYNQKQFRINYVEDVNGVGGEVDGKLFFEKAWKPFIDEYIETGYCREANLELLLRKYMHTKMTMTMLGDRTNCGSKYCGAGVNIIEIEPDGEVFYCGRYSEPYPVARIQNALTYDFLGLHQIKRYVDFVKLRHEVLENYPCDTCFAKSVCDHGCMAFHYSKFETWGVRTDLICDIYKSTYLYFEEHGPEIFAAMVKDKPESIFPLDRNDHKIFRKQKTFDILRDEYHVDIVKDPDSPIVKIINRDYDQGE